MIHSCMKPLTAMAALLSVFIVLVGASPRQAKQTAGSGPRNTNVSGPAGATSLGLSPFADIHSAILNDYLTYQFKITYLGPQLKSTPSLFGHGTGRSFDLAAFAPYHRAFDYSNDEQQAVTLTLSSVEFKAFVDGLAFQPSLTDTTLIAEPNLSLMILRDSGPATRCWEHLCPTDAQSDSLFEVLHDALPDPTRQAIVDSFRHQMAGVRR